MPSPILARADALMQRRRQNAPDNDDIPVLTDSVVDEPPSPAAPSSAWTTPVIDAGPAPVFETPPPLMFEPFFAVDRKFEPKTAAPPAATASPLLLETLSKRIEARLAAELPRLIEATLREVLAEQADKETPTQG